MSQSVKTVGPDEPAALGVAAAQATPDSQTRLQAGDHQEPIRATRPAAAPDPRVQLRLELGAIDLLSGMGDELLDMVAARCPIRELAQGQTLLHAGQTNAEIFLILRGTLHVFLADNRDVPVATLHLGDTVGELSVLDKGPTSANVVAHEPTVVLCINEDMFWHVVHASHGFAVRLIIKLSERLRANNNTVQVNRELCAHFEQVALSDALTGVHSRRWLQDTLPRLCDRHRFDKQPLSLAVVDIDHFKQVNDRHGHQTGDLVLCEVAKTMRRGLRPTDYIARFGGEEFVLIFPRTPLAGATVAAERQREVVQSAAMQGSDGSALPHVTVSIGVSELQPGQDANMLIHHADIALYRAKSKGRNRVEF